MMTPRGRPRKFSENLIDRLIHDDDLTPRGAQNFIYRAIAQMQIIEQCTIDTQRYFLGGRTGVEATAGKPKLHREKIYVMQELGRHPRDNIAAMAEAMANNRTFDTWTQQEIVDFLKDIRLGRDQVGQG